MARVNLPERDELVTFNHAAAGHPGTMCDPDGELFIKPCRQTEIDFYQTAQRLHPDFSDLMPLYMGVLTWGPPAASPAVTDPTRAPGLLINTLGLPIISCPDPPTGNPNLPTSTSQKPLHLPPVVQQRDVKGRTLKAPIETDLAVVLENATHGFRKPNILDVKLGVRLWDDHAPLEKRLRLDRVTAQSTHATLGFGISGMRIFAGADDPAELQSDGYLTFGKTIDRTAVTPHNVTAAFRRFLSGPASLSSPVHARAVARGFLSQLRRIERVLARVEIRLFASSLLFVYEGDGPTLQNALQLQEYSDSAALDPGSAVTAPPTDVQADVETDGKLDSGSDQADDDDSDEDGDRPALPNAWALKLIDFGHSYWTPGQGRDESVLLGVRSLVTIFETLTAEP